MMALHVSETDVPRFVEFAVAAAILVVLSPLIAVTAIAVRICLGSPVLFRQMRPGLRGEPFELVKFRTMTDARDADGALLPDEQRLTNFGVWLRSTSLDELPELFNVLVGDMALVGPRPLLMEYLERYSSEQACRHEVRPGLTGWAQIRGRNAVSWEEKLALDAWYVDNRSVWLDLRILAETVLVVVARHGITREGHATAPRFDAGTEGDAPIESSDNP